MASPSARWLPLAIVLLLGCGRIDYDPRPPDGSAADGTVAIDAGPAVDAGTGMDGATASDAGAGSDGGVDADAGVDAGADGGSAGPCAWGDPTPVPGILTAAGEYQPSLTDDGLRICFTSNRGGGNIDIYCAQRASTADDFGAPQVQNMINSGSADRMPALSADGSEMFFVSNRLGDDDIFRATWSTAMGRYRLDGLVPELATPNDEAGPELSADGLTLYFDARMGGGNLRIYRTTRAAVGMAFGEPTEITELTAPEDTSEPALSSDGSLMVFCTTRPTPGRSTTSTLWCSERAGSSWATPTPVAAVGLDTRGACSPAIGPAGELYYNTQLPAGPGGADIVVAPPL